MPMHLWMQIRSICKYIYLLSQEEYRTLSLVSRDHHPMNVFNIEYMVDNTNLGFLATDAESNFIVFMYQPESRESQGGQKLLRKADYHVGQRINALFRIQCNNVSRNWMSSYENKHTTFFGMAKYSNVLSKIKFTHISIFILDFSHARRWSWLLLTAARKDI